MVNGSQGVFAGILRIVEKLYLIFIDQVFKFFFQISHYDGNIKDTCFVKLADLPFHHSFSEDFQKSFGHFKGERDKPGTKSGSKDNRPIYLAGFQKRFSFWKQGIGFIRSLTQVPGRDSFLYQVIDSTQGQVQL